MSNLRGLGRLILPDGAAEWTEYLITVTKDDCGQLAANGFISQGEVAWRAKASQVPATLVMEDGREAQLQVMTHDSDYGRYAVEYVTLP